MEANTGLRDAISWLPDEVLGNILSLLPTKLAASTSVLAKKWRHVFRLAHTLDFDDSDLLQPEEEGKEEWPVIFKNFVDRTLALQCGSPINNFSLKLHIHDEKREMPHVSAWIRNALERGVLEMSLSLKKEYKRLYLPSELLTSKTLVKLTLGTQIYLGEFPPNVSLPALKSLFIDSIVFGGYDDLCGVLLRGCPLLEELYVRHRKCEGAPFCICNPTVKKLSVYYEFEFSREGMSFDTPSLVSLDYRDFALDEYRDLNLASLVEARLDIHYSKSIKDPDLSGLITGISNVQILHLSPASADVISRCVEDGLVLPVFKNLLNLSFGSYNERGWKLLPYLLKQSPKVETLIIQGLDGGYTDNVFTIGLFLQVKELHVVGYKGTAKELQHLKSLLAGTECIPRVRVVFPEDVVVDSATIIQTRRDLFTLVGVVSTDVLYFD